MCPICITSYIVYSVCSILGLFGLKGFVKYIKLKYYTWSGTKCEKCKNREYDADTKCTK